MPKQNYDHDYDTTIHRPSYLKAFIWLAAIRFHKHRIYPITARIHLLEGAGVKQELQGVVHLAVLGYTRSSVVLALASSGREPSWLFISYSVVLYSWAYFTLSHCNRSLS